MKAILLKNDGRCKWLENKILKTLVPEMIKAKSDPTKKTMYLIEDWVSNEGGKFGIRWESLERMGIPVVKSFQELPTDNNFIIVNTGYDSIVDEEKILIDKKIEYIDEPCPFIRKIRKIFEHIDNKYQYVLLCEPNHIIMKNFKSLYPKDMILVQMENYRERILTQQIGKPLKLVPYVTFLPSHINRVNNFINEMYPDRDNEVLKTSCLWVSSNLSPITEIQNMNSKELEGVSDALLIISPGSMNTSAESLVETLEDKGLRVIKISSLKEFIKYDKANRDSKVLIVRSPIPNNAEEPIITYIKKGILVTYSLLFMDFLKRGCKS